MRSFLKKLYFAFAYRLYARRKLHKSGTFRFKNFTLSIQPGVFHPELFFTSRYFAEYILSLSLQGKTVLDLGCGSGILSLCAAERGATVTSIDINEQAVTLTTFNAQKNKLSHAVTALCSDMFSSLPEGARYDTILVNPPFYKKKPLTIQEHAWYAGNDYQYFHAFAKLVRSYLAPGGAVYMILSTDGDLDTTLAIFSGNGLCYEKLTEKRVLLETLIIYKIH